MDAAVKRRAHFGDWGWFCAWALVGTGFALGISVIGIFTVPAALVATILLVRRRPIRGAFGALSGAGALLLYLAYLNRQGPGTVCSPFGLGGEHCTDYWNPLPFLIAGLMCVVGGIAAHARQNR